MSHSLQEKPWTATLAQSARHLKYLVVVNRSTRGPKTLFRTEGIRLGMAGCFQLGVMDW
jgi:hypothetical protein